VRDALAQGLPITGASVHYVTTEVDAGPLLLREEVPISPDDDEERLHARIKAVEHRLLPRAVAMALAEIERKERRGWRAI
jgi:phosphoribosylglycinamide formyltransferase-1